MEKRDLKEKTKYFALKIFKTVSSTSRNSAFPACAGASAGKRNPKSAFQNWVSFRLFHSAIRNPQSAMGSRGFTLIEIIILIVMAGILLPVIIVPFVTGVKGSQKPEMTATATYLAHQKMEEFMKYRYLDSALNPIAMTSYADISGFSGYQWQWERLYVDSDFLNPDLVTHRGYKRILVRVKDPMNDTYEIYSVVAFSP